MTSINSEDSLVEASLSTIRRLSPHEAYLASMASTLYYTFFGSGALDEHLLGRAVGLLCDINPVLRSQLEPTEDGEGIVLRLDEGWLPECSFKEGEPDVLPQRSELKIENGVFGIRVVTRGDRFRIVCAFNHSVADGTASVQHVRRLFELYTGLVETGSAGPTIVRPIPSSPEELFHSRGIAKMPTDEFLRQSFGEELSGLFNSFVSGEIPPPPPLVSEEADSEQSQPSLLPDPNDLTVPRASLILTPEKTRAIMNYTRSNGVTLQGVLFAVAILAEFLLDEALDTLTVQLRTAVEMRHRVVPPVEDVLSVSNLVGESSVTVSVQRDSDLVDCAKQVVEQIARDSELGMLPQNPLQKAGLIKALQGYEEFVFSLPRPNVIYITNIGKYPVLPLPAGVVFDDLRAGVDQSLAPEQFNGAYRASNQLLERMYVAYTFQDRLHLELFGSSSLKFAQLIPALESAVEALLGTV